MYFKQEKLPPLDSAPSGASMGRILDYDDLTYAPLMMQFLLNNRLNQLSYENDPNPSLQVSAIAKIMDAESKRYAQKVTPKNRVKKKPDLLNATAREEELMQDFFEEGTLQRLTALRD